MLFKICVAIVAMVAMLATASTPPCPRCHYPSSTDLSSATTISVSTLFGIATLDFTTTIVTTISPSSTEASSKPTYTATQLYAYREDSPIHLLPIQARGLYFQLGGLPTTVCPSNIKDCPPGVMTGINQCELSVVVAGGQQVYLKPDGSLRFTASHSVAMAPGSIQCPLTFADVSTDVSEVSVHGFGATSLMACPMLNSTRIPEQWQVYVNIPNASVPLANATVSSCLDFEAVGVRYLGDTPAAYGYV